MWIYPPLEDAMAEAGLQEVETYISRRQNTATQFIATSPIMDLFLAAERIPGPRIFKWWWEYMNLLSIDYQLNRIDPIANIISAQCRAGIKNQIRDNNWRSISI